MSFDIDRQKKGELARRKIEALRALVKRGREGIEALERAARDFRKKDMKSLAEITHKQANVLTAHVAVVEHTIIADYQEASEWTGEE